MTCISVSKPKTPNPSPVEKRFGVSCLTTVSPLDSTHPLETAGEAALRVAFTDFSTTPWRGFEKSERGPNNSSLFRPQAAVVVVAVQVLLSAVAAKGNHIDKTKKTAYKSCLSWCE